jgi:hypothetical protein
MPERLSGLIAQKSGLRSGSLEDSVPLRCPSPPDQLESAEMWAEPGKLHALLMLGPTRPSWRHPQALVAV